MHNKILNEFKGKKILIWGMGKEGLSSYKFIKKHLPEMKLYLSDSKCIDKEQYFNDIIVDEKLLNLNEYDLVLKAPGIVLHDHFENVQSQSSIFLKYFKENVIGITGTKGKSTTSTLLYHVLKENYPSTFLVGNIGIPCFDIIEDMLEDSVVVFEISCHQLEHSKYSPHLSVLLNIYEEHLDHYKSFDDYKTAKKQIYLNQDESDIAIINSDLKKEIENRNNIVWSNETIYAKDNVLFNDLSSIKIEKTNLIGKHNMYNMAIVYYIAHVLYGVTNNTFLKRIESFTPLAHRLENIGTYDGITYINDSISTIGQATIQALESITNVGSVLIGGMDRGIDYTQLIEYLKKSNVENIILMYETGKRIFNSLKRENVYIVNDLYEAVSLAKKITKKGKSCVLSPAAASYGYFKNFEDRGEEFKRLVM